MEGPVGYLLQVPTVAEQLREARQSMKLDIQQVADATKLKTDHVRALEEGDFEAFTAPIYLRGSLRTYARLLKLDSQKLLAELDNELGATGRGEEPSLTPSKRKSGLDSMMLVMSRVNWAIVAILIVLGLVGLGVTAGFRAWRAQRTSDPYKKLGAGIYQPPPDSGETLPIPTNIAANRR
jgi:cytoskeleton protein RodZ